MANSPNTQPIFIREPAIWTASIMTDTGVPNPSVTQYKTIATGADPGSIIESLFVQPTGLMVASTLYLYVYHSVETAGENRLITFFNMPAITTGLPGVTDLSGLMPRTLSPASPTTTPNRALKLPQGWELRAALSTAIANPLIITATGGNY